MNHVFPIDKLLAAKIKHFDGIKSKTRRIFIFLSLI